MKVSFMKNQGKSKKRVEKISVPNHALSKALIGNGGSSEQGVVVMQDWKGRLMRDLELMKTEVSSKQGAWGLQKRGDLKMQDEKSRMQGAVNKKIESASTIISYSRPKDSCIINSNLLIREGVK